MALPDASPAPAANPCMGCKSIMAAARRPALGVLIIAAGTLPGCKSPFAHREIEPDLQQIVAQAIQQEVGETSEPVPTLKTTQSESQVLVELAPREAELDKISPAMDPNEAGNLGPDLFGRDQERVAVALQSVITSSIQRNLAAEQARLQPGIAQQDVIIAQAAFDFLLFSNVNLSKIDEPQQVPVVGGVPLGSPFNANEQYFFETGIRKQFTTGAVAQVDTNLTRFQDNSPGIFFIPDPAYTAAVDLSVTQPLLRNFGEDVNTATIRLAENTKEQAVQQLRLTLLDTVQSAEHAYWDLVQAWRELSIKMWLVDVGIQVRDVLARRRDFDTKLAQYSDAVATVEQRRAEVIRAQRLVRFASDQLKQIINDPALSVGSEAVLWPQDDLVESPITYNVLDAMMTAISNRPEVQQAILGINNADIQQLVADNQRLPLLNLAAQMSFFGLDDTPGGSYDNLGSGNFIDYLLGIAFEYPLGNRAAEAAYQQARMQRTSAVIGYQQSVQSVVLNVKNALRDVITSYDLIMATRSFRVAQAENLRTLLVEEETMAGLTPTFLNLKFQQQETLAQARQQEVAALANFDKSLASLYRAMGTGLVMKGIEVEPEQ
jgi:outer membrane protein